MKDYQHRENKHKEINVTERNRDRRGRETGRECTYRAEVEALPGLQSPDLRREQKSRGDIHF